MGYREPILSWLLVEMRWDEMRWDEVRYDIYLNDLIAADRYQ
jgi:hypothetical protein